MAGTSAPSKSVFDLFAVDSDSTLGFSDEEDEHEDTDALISERIQSVREGLTFCHMSTLLLFGLGRICASLMLYFSIDLYKVGRTATLYFHNTSVYVVFFAFFVPCILAAVYVLALYALVRPKRREPWRRRVAYALFVLDVVLFVVILKFWFVTNAFAALALILALPVLWTVLLLRPTGDQILVAAVVLTLFALACLLLLGVIALFSSIF